MRNLAFAELEMQVETLPMSQIFILKEKLEKMIEKAQDNEKITSDSPLVESMIGIVPSLSENYKELIADAVSEKYL